MSHPPTVSADRVIHPITALTPDAPPSELAALHDTRADRATVLALGATVRTAHELLLLGHRVLRYAIRGLGFRALALEGDPVASARLDAYLRTGQGDPQEILRAARPFLRTRELVDVLRWMRSVNERDPAAGLRVVHPEPAHAGASQNAANANDIAALERVLAAEVLAWHERTGDRIVYWGGFSHTMVAAHRETTTLAPCASVGAHLRDRLGAGYVSVALTFTHGEVPEPISTPGEALTDARLAILSPHPYLVDLRSPGVRTELPWLDEPARLRIIGPHEDVLTGGTFAEWCDAVLHHHTVTPATFLA